MQKVKEMVNLLLKGLILFAILTYMGMSGYNNDWTTYGVNLLARVGEFSNYFVAQSAVNHITPQFFADYMIIGLMKIIPSYQLEIFILFLITCMILVYGIIALSRKISYSNYFSCAAVLVIYFVKNNFGYQVSGNVLWGNTLIHAYLSTALCIWALYFVFGRKKCFSLAYLMCIISALIQIQIGFYFGIIIFAYQIIYSFIKKQSFNFNSMLIWILPMLGLFYLFSSTSNKMLTNQEFVEIYGRLRHPHHMIPSSWSFSGYVSFSLFVIAILILSYKKLYKSKEYTEIHIWLITITTITIVALFANYFFTDIYPWALIVKIQPARMVSVLLIALSITLAISVGKFLDDNDYIPIIGIVSLLFANTLFRLVYISIFLIISVLIYLLLLLTSVHQLLPKLAETCSPILPLRFQG